MNDHIFNSEKNWQTHYCDQKVSAVEIQHLKFCTTLPTPVLLGFWFLLNCAFSKNFSHFFSLSTEGRALRKLLPGEKWSPKMFQDDRYNYAFSPVLYPEAAKLILAFPYHNCNEALVNLVPLDMLNITNKSDI